MKMEDIVFFEEENTETGEHVSPQLLLACNAKQQEDWLRKELDDFEESGRVKNLAELQKHLKDCKPIDMAILLKRNKVGGVYKSDEMARAILEHSPDAQVLIIVGSNDAKGQKIIQAADEMGCRTLVANDGQKINGEMIQQVVQEMADEIRQKFEELEETWEEEQELDSLDEKQLLHVVYIEGAKGGSGRTTALVALARSLKEKQKEVIVLDDTQGCTFMIKEEEGIKVRTSKELPEWPEKGWVLVDGAPPESIEEDEDKVVHHVLITDPSLESLNRAQKKIKPDTIIIVNRTLESIPTAIYENELQREPSFMVYADPSSYLIMDTEKVLSDWKPLLSYIS